MFTIGAALATAKKIWKVHSHEGTYIACLFLSIAHWSCRPHNQWEGALSLLHKRLQCEAVRLLLEAIMEEGAKIKWGASIEEGKMSTLGDSSIDWDAKKRDRHNFLKCKRNFKNFVSDRKKASESIVVRREVKLVHMPKALLLRP